MSRLIDAGALLQEIEGLSVHITGLRSGKGALSNFMNEYRKTVLRIIDEQPTAFDTEKVVEELESLSNAEADYYYARSNDVIDREDAIDIVKKGGVE